MQIKIDSNAIQQYEKKLTSLKRSAFPNAIRATLNDAAFEMKKDNLHTSAANNFKHTRSKNFFKRFSGVKKATGWDVNKMQSTIGMLDMGVKTAKTAINNMEKHEKGGNISDGAVYLPDSRTSKIFGRLVRKVNYFKKGNVIGGKASFVAKAYKSTELKAPMKHNGFLIQVTNIRKTKKGKIKITSRLLMKERENVKIKPNHFILKAATQTQKNIPVNFKKNAEKQIKRFTQ